MGIERTIEMLQAKGLTVTVDGIQDIGGKAMPILTVDGLTMTHARAYEIADGTVTIAEAKAIAEREANA